MSEAGIQPDILVCRTEHPLPMDIRKKVALFCNVHINSVIESRDAETIYDVPLMMKREKLDERVLTRLKLPHKIEADIDTWKDFLGKLKNPTCDINIAVVGKYVELPDAYKSIAESFVHAGAENECKVKVSWIQSEHLTAQNIPETLSNIHGLLLSLIHI